MQSDDSRRITSFRIQRQNQERQRLDDGKGKSLFEGNEFLENLFLHFKVSINSFSSIFP
jgi:hypothetical protein